MTVVDNSKPAARPTLAMLPNGFVVRVNQARISPPRLSIAPV